MKNKGQSIIELLIAITLMIILLPALFNGIIASRDGRSQMIQQLQALSLVRETEEAVRIIRERDWHEIETNGTYHPEESGNSFSLASGSEVINGFNRSLIIADGIRDTS